MENFSARAFRNLAVYTVSGAILLKFLTAHTSEGVNVSTTS